jgi:hypothetical protein
MICTTTFPSTTTDEAISRITAEELQVSAKKLVEERLA